MIHFHELFVINIFLGARIAHTLLYIIVFFVGGLKAVFAVSVGSLVDVRLVHR